MKGTGLWTSLLVLGFTQWQWWLYSDIYWCRVSGKIKQFFWLNTGFPLAWSNHISDLPYQENSFFFNNYFIVVQLQLSAFSPHLSPPSHPNPPPSLASTLPLGFVHTSFIVVPENPSPHWWGQFLSKVYKVTLGLMSRLEMRSRETFTTMQRKNLHHH